MEEFSFSIATPLFCFNLDDKIKTLSSSFKISHDFIFGTLVKIISSVVGNFLLLSILHFLLILGLTTRFTISGALSKPIFSVFGLSASSACLPADIFSLTVSLLVPFRFLPFRSCKTDFFTFDFSFFFVPGFAFFDVPDVLGLLSTVSLRTLSFGKSTSIIKISFSGSLRFFALTVCDVSSLGLLRLLFAGVSIGFVSGGRSVKPLKFESQLSLLLCFDCNFSHEFILPAEFTCFSLSPSSTSGDLNNDVRTALLVDLSDFLVLNFSGVEKCNWRTCELLFVLLPSLLSVVTTGGVCNLSVGKSPIGKPEFSQFTAFRLPSTICSACKTLLRTAFCKSFVTKVS
uniref:Uncharacterized protein n=1 Tax=Photinus pyralis TaxID=7054 RepID=A0A1Y1K9G5_PHOPY